MEEGVKMSEPVGGNAENNVKHEELSELVTALKDAVMELRETVTELTNPLNRLSREPELIATQPASNNHNDTTLQDTVNISEDHNLKELNTSLQNRQKYNVRTAAGRSSDAGSGIDEVSGSSLMIPPVLKGPALRSRKGKMNLKRITKLLRLVFELRGKVHPELIEKYVDIFVGLGLISDEEAGILRNLLKVVDEGYKHGLEAEDHVALLMLLAKSLGIEDEELEEEGMRLLIKTITEKKEVNRASNSSRELEES